MTYFTFCGLWLSECQGHWNNWGNQRIFSCFWTVLKCLSAKIWDQFSLLATCRYMLLTYPKSMKCVLFPSIYQQFSHENAFSCIVLYAVQIIIEQPQANIIQRNNGTVLYFSNLCSIFFLTNTLQFSLHVSSCNPPMSKIILIPSRVILYLAEDTGWNEMSNLIGQFLSIGTPSRPDIGSP